jgi:hypothetical protein
MTCNIVPELNNNKMTGGNKMTGKTRAVEDGEISCTTKGASIFCATGSLSGTLIGIGIGAAALGTTALGTVAGALKMAGAAAGGGVFGGATGCFFGGDCTVNCNDGEKEPLLATGELQTQPPKRQHNP